MPKRRDVVAEQLRALADDMDELWKAATRDPKKEARRERAWGLLEGALVVGATMAVRRAVVKLWPILTGESAPMPRPGEAAQKAAPAEPGPQPQQVESAAAQAEPEVAQPEVQSAEAQVTQADEPTQTIPSASPSASPTGER